MYAGFIKGQIQLIFSQFCIFCIFSRDMAYGCCVLSTAFPASQTRARIPSSAGSEGRPVPPDQDPEGKPGGRGSGASPAGSLAFHTAANAARPGLPGVDQWRSLAPKSAADQHCHPQGSTGGQTVKSPDTLKFIVHPFFRFLNPLPPLPADQP